MNVEVSNVPFQSTHQRESKRLERVRVMLILGHQLGPGDEAPIYMLERLRMLELRKQKPWNRIILCGGKTNPGQVISEAERMEREIKQNKRLSSLWEVLYLEAQSRDTVENIQNALNFLNAEYPFLRQGRAIEVTVVTHSWHMKRAIDICHRIAGKRSRFQFSSEEVIDGSPLPLSLAFRESLKNLCSWLDPELKLVRRIFPLPVIE